MPSSRDVDLTHLSIGNPGCRRAAVVLLASAALIAYWLAS